MLTAARDLKAEQALIAERGVREVRRVARRGTRQASRMLAVYQGYAIASALDAASPQLAEQGISTASTAAVSVASLLTGPSAAELMDQAQTDLAFERLITSLIFDAGRTASAVDTATRPAVTGTVRTITTPCCGRCAVLAGRVYRWNAWFQRHPQCNCVPTPTDISAGRELATNPDELFRKGQIRGLSRADMTALNSGADLAQVVNVRRKQAGLVRGSSVLVRAGRPTPQFLMNVASDKAEAVALLTQHGYVR